VAELVDEQFVDEDTDTTIVVPDFCDAYARVNMVVIRKDLVGPFLEIFTVV
jgi:hypothetical protein